MSSPSDKLAESMKVLAGLQRQQTRAIRARDLSRTHRERLLKHGFLLRVMNGWLIPSRPGDAEGESTAWYASYWAVLRGLPAGTIQDAMVPFP